MSGFMLLQLGNETIKQMMLTYIVTKLDEGAFEELLAAGMSASLLDSLHALTAREMLHLSLAKTLNLSLHIDVPSLERSLSQIGMRKTTTKMQEYFLLNHASPAMIHELFRLGYQEQEYARTALGVIKLRGRPRLPDIATRDRIHQMWFDSSSQASTIERYYQLHQQFNAYTLATLYAVVNEF